jgi:hypothetical protein
LSYVISGKMNSFFYFNYCLALEKIITPSGMKCEEDSDISESLRGAGAGLEAVALGVVVGVLVGFKNIPVDSGDLDRSPGHGPCVGVGNFKLPPRVWSTPSTLRRAIPRRAG